MQILLQLNRIEPPHKDKNNDDKIITDGIEIIIVVIMKTTHRCSHKLKHM